MPRPEATELAAQGAQVLGAEPSAFPLVLFQNTPKRAEN